MCIIIGFIVECVALSTYKKNADVCGPKQKLILQFTHELIIITLASAILQQHINKYKFNT